jgi:hypothetical protein
MSIAASTFSVPTPCVIRSFPVEIVSIILSFYLDTEEDVHLNTNLRQGHDLITDDTYTRFKLKQASLSILMRFNHAWAHAGIPALYRPPLICTGEALESLSNTLEKRPEHANFLRTLVVLPFKFTHGQIKRSELPRTVQRAQIRVEYGSYSHLARILSSCTQLHTRSLPFVEMRAILPMSTYLKTKSLRSLSLCGICLG